MTLPRTVFCLVMSGILLLAQLHVGGAKGCSMCGATCRCASHLAGDSCSVRSVGCGGGDDGATFGSIAPLRAILAASSLFAPRFEIGRARVNATRVPAAPARPPLDRPPRVSC